MKLIEKVVDVALRFRIWLFLICVGLVGIAIAPSTRLQFERSIENLFRKNDPRYVSYREDQRLFGGLETAVIAYDDDNLFSIEGLTRLASLQQRIMATPGINGATSLNDLRRQSAPLDGRKLLEQLQTGTVSAEQLQSEILATDLYRGRFVSKDGKTVVMLVDLAAVKDDPKTRADAILRLRELCNESNPPHVLTGGPILVEEVYSTLEHDGFLLGVASSLILTLVIALLFRSLRWTLLPLAVVHVTLVWTKAILALSGLKLSMVSAPLVALVTVIGVATVVHIMLRYREERESADPQLAMRRTLIHIVPAVFWTCLTTAAGFAALTACSVSPIQNFGMMMALASLLVFAATILLVPAAGLFAAGPRTSLGRIPGEKRVANGLERIVGFVKLYPMRLSVIAVFLFAMCLLGILRLNVATDFTDNFRKDSSIVQAYFFVRDRLGSVNTVDVVIDVPSPMSTEFETTVQKIRELQTELESTQNVDDTLSFVDLLDFVGGQNQSTGGGLASWLPSINVVPKRAQLALLDQVQPRVVGGFWNQKENAARIIVQAGHVEGALGKAQLIEKIESISTNRFDTTRVAGIFVLLAYVVQSLMADQWITFGLSVTAIFLIMTFAFRSFSLGFVALLPNAAPIAMVVGTMGWFNINMNIATAMIASVSMGLAVDFSIHYLTRFQAELRQTNDFYAAIAAAHGSVGMAMFVANLALISGFLVLTLSALIPSVHFGILVSVAMIGGLVGNLFVLPLLLRLLWSLNLIQGNRPE